MKAIPILFSTPMVQAIIYGSKTQTRRIVKPQPDENGVSYMPNAPLDWEQVYGDEWKPWHFDTAETERHSMHCPYGQRGDILWVRETFAIGNESGYFYFKANNEIKPNGTTNWKPSIHMPKEAARIFLEITDVRVERLQNISEKDAIAEGVKKHSDFGSTGYVLYTEPEAAHTDIDAVWSFESLWQSINGSESWNKNPWVWVIEFKKIEKPRWWEHHVKGLAAAY